jgi:hypothetical protein
MACQSLSRSFGDARVSLNYDWVDHVQVVALGARRIMAAPQGRTANGVLRSGNGPILRVRKLSLGTARLELGQYREPPEWLAQPAQVAAAHDVV